MRKKFFIKKNKAYPHLYANRCRRGFTLVETLVALSIFTTSILALLSVLTQGIADTNYAKRKIIANYLSQEGIEYVRNMRDTFVLYNGSTQAGWDDFKVKIAPCLAANGCYLEDQDLVYSDEIQPMTEIDVNACDTSCPSLKYSQETGKYGYAYLADSGYTRKTVITQINANELKVSTTVFWSQGSGSFNIVLSENLFNWLE